MYDKWTHGSLRSIISTVDQAIHKLALDWLRGLSHGSLTWQGTEVDSGNNNDSSSSCVSSDISLDERLVLFLGRCKCGAGGTTW